MRVRQIRIEFDRALREFERVLDRRGPLILYRERLVPVWLKPSRQLSQSETANRRCICRVSGNRMLIIRARRREHFTRLVALPALHDIIAAQPMVISGKRVGRLGECPFQFGPGDASNQGSDDFLRHFVLDREDARKLAIVVFGPQLRGGFRIDKLGGDPDALGIPPNTAYQQIAHPELAPDLSHVEVRAPITLLSKVIAKTSRSNEVSTI